MRETKQAVILAGGLATRLRPLTNETPKSMLPVGNKPFLEYQINLLRENGISNIVICLGHLGEQVMNYFGDGGKFNVCLSYSCENKQLLGTGGALKKAEPLLNKTFYVLYGDSYLPVDYQRLLKLFHRCDKRAAMIVYKNYNRFDTSNVAVEQLLVKKYDKVKQTPDMIYIDAGLLILKKSTLGWLKSGRRQPLEKLLQKLVDKRQLLAFETKQRFYEVGSFAGLAEFSRLVKRVSCLQL